MKRKESSSSRYAPKNFSSLVFFSRRTLGLKLEKNPYGKGNKRLVQIKFYDKDGEECEMEKGTVATKTSVKFFYNRYHTYKSETNESGNTIIYTEYCCKNRKKDCYKCNARIIERLLIKYDGEVKDYAEKQFHTPSCIECSTLPDQNNNETLLSSILDMEDGEEEELEIENVEMKEKMVEKMVDEDVEHKRIQTPPPPMMKPQPQQQMKIVHPPQMMPPSSQPPPFSSSPEKNMYLDLTYFHKEELEIQKDFNSKYLVQFCYGHSFHYHLTNRCSFNNSSGSNEYNIYKCGKCDAKVVEKIGDYFNNSESLFSVQGFHKCFKPFKVIGISNNNNYVTVGTVVNFYVSVPESVTARIFRNNICVYFNGYRIQNVPGKVSVLSVEMRKDLPNEAFSNYYDEGKMLVSFIIPSLKNVVPGSNIDFGIEIIGKNVRTTNQLYLTYNLEKEKSKKRKRSNNVEVEQRSPEFSDGRILNVQPNMGTITGGEVVRINFSLTNVAMRDGFDYNISFFKVYFGEWEVKVRSLGIRNEKRNIFYLEVITPNVRYPKTVSVTVLSFLNNIITRCFLTDCFTFVNRTVISYVTSESLNQLQKNDNERYYPNSVSMIENELYEEGEEGDINSSNVVFHKSDEERRKMRMKDEKTRKEKKEELLIPENESQELIRDCYSPIEFYKSDGEKMNFDFENDDTLFSNFQSFM